MAKRNKVAMVDDVIGTETREVPSVNIPEIAGLVRIREQYHAQIQESNATIAELEAWRSEIEATIAFLKAQRR